MIILYTTQNCKQDQKCICVVIRKHAHIVKAVSVITDT